MSTVSFNKCAVIELRYDHPFVGDLKVNTHLFQLLTYRFPLLLCDGIKLYLPLPARAFLVDSIAHATVPHAGNFFYLMLVTVTLW